MNLRKLAQGQDCMVNGCNNPIKSNGMCKLHYMRFWRTGETDKNTKKIWRDKAINRLLNGYIPVTESGCWIWEGDLCNSGYGKFSMNNKTTTAHRASYELLVGPIIKGLNVLHSCDVRACINPKHLRCGTQKENVMDAVSRYKVGKLSRNEILAIKSDQRSTRKIGKDYGVSSACISEIKRGASWQI